MYMVALFALLVSVMTKLELRKRDKILISIILCLFFVQVVHGMLDQLGVIDYCQVNLQVSDKVEITLSVHPQL